MADHKTFFAPQLFIPNGTTDISFYTKGFGGVESKMFKNDDGSIHVAEFLIDDAIFQLHEQRSEKDQFDVNRAGGVTALIGLFVEDVDAAMKRAIEAGATLLSPAQDYDYGYRQGRVRDPFGHQWMLEKKI